MHKSTIPPLQTEAAANLGDNLRRAFRSVDDRPPVPADSAWQPEPDVPAAPPREDEVR